MTDQSDDDETYPELMAAIGTMIFLWSAIERELAASLVRLDEGSTSKRIHGIGQTLDEWERRMGAQSRNLSDVEAAADNLIDHLRIALRIRNGICHGLMAVIGKGHIDGPPSIHFELNGEKGAVTGAELNAMFRWMSKAPGIIAGLTRAAAGSQNDAKWISHVWSTFPERR